MYDVEVIDGVPLPPLPKRNARGGRYTTPLCSLSVGQCVFIPLEENQKLRSLYNSVRVNVHRAVKTSAELEGFKFKIRETAHPKTQVTGVGVWRVE
jgi:hypothetical protein